MIIQEIILRKVIVACAIVGGTWLGLSYFSKEEPKKDKKLTKAPLPDEEKIEKTDTVVLSSVRRDESDQENASDRGQNDNSDSQEKKVVAADKSAQKQTEEVIEGAKKEKEAIDAHKSA